MVKPLSTMSLAILDLLIILHSLHNIVEHLQIPSLIAKQFWPKIERPLSLLALSSASKDGKG
jgi:hypothetical protein